MARPYLGNPKYTIEVLQKYHFVFQKRFGQNFLIDEHVLEKIIDSSGITKDDFILEIGPGIGTMTQYLAEAAREVAAVEIDSSLIPILKDTLKEWDNVTVINNDILKTDIKKIADEKNGGKPVKVVANLPYYITTPIIMGLFALLRNPMQYITDDSMIFAFHESFAWIADLSQPDRWILPIIAGVATFISFSMTQALSGGTDANNQMAGSMKMMKYIFPVMILWMARSFPSGLALYWAVSQIMQIGFNIHLNSVRKKMKREAEEKRLVGNRRKSRV